MVHNVRFSALDGSPCPGEARLRLSGDRKTLTVSVADGGTVGPDAVEVWRLTRAGHWSARQATSPGPSAFVVVVLDTASKRRPGHGFRLVFDLAQAATFSGSIDASYLTARGIKVADAGQAAIGGLFSAPSPAPKREERVQAPTSPALQHPELARLAPAPAPRARAARRRRKQPTGPFATRRDLTARVWALRRQQVFPNLAAIARACETTPDVVKTIIEEREGLDTYLQQGCLIG
ncbi:MAG TPA: hypothetical protein VGR19_01625 [Allosphingosinicella sp.]|nr:hypothetical protein [Allosphingosinicella sp.]